MEFIVLLANSGRLTLNILQPFCVMKATIFAHQRVGHQGPVSCGGTGWGALTLSIQYNQICD